MPASSLRERRLQVVTQATADRGELHLAAGAFEETGTEALLQPADGLAHPGGGDVQALGRAAEVELLGEGEEDLDLASFHADSFVIAEVNEVTVGRRCSKALGDGSSSHDPTHHQGHHPRARRHRQDRPPRRRATGAPRPARPSRFTCGHAAVRLGRRSDLVAGARRRARRLHLVLPRSRRPRGLGEGGRLRRGRGGRRSRSAGAAVRPGRGGGAGHREAHPGPAGRLDHRARQLVQPELQRELPARRRPERRGRPAGRRTRRSRSSMPTTSPTSRWPRSPRTATPGSSTR